MRGHELHTVGDQTIPVDNVGASMDSLLRDIRDELRGIHQALQERKHV